MSRHRRQGLIRLAMAIGLGAAVVASACGGGPKKVKHARHKGSADDEDPDAKALLQQARAAASKGDIDRADTAYAAAYQSDHRFSTLAEHIHLLISARRPERAVEVSKRYYDEHSDDTKGFALYAEALIEAGQTKDALEVTDQLLQLDDSAAKNHSLRGRALILDKQNDAGLDELRKALQIDGKDPVVLMAVGEALQKSGKPEEAAIYLRTAVKLDADNPHAYVLLGAALRDEKEIEDAKVALHKAMELDPESGRPYFELGILHNQLAEQADAEQALAKAVELDPDDTTYWYAYGEILRLRAIVDPKHVDAGKLDLAINAYKRALEIHPPHPKAATKLVESYLTANRHDEAEVLLTGMLRADPDSAQNYYYLGAVYAHATKYKLAIDAYEKFLDLAAKTDPERDRVKKAILELKRRL